MLESEANASGGHSPLNERDGVKRRDAKRSERAKLDAIARGDWEHIGRRRQRAPSRRTEALPAAAAAENLVSPQILQTARKELVHPIAILLSVTKMRHTLLLTLTLNPIRPHPPLAPSTACCIALPALRCRSVPCSPPRQSHA